MADKDSNQQQPDDTGADLHTGLRPATPTFGNEDQQSERVRLEKEKQAQEAKDLLPIADTVLEVIENERNDIRDYHSYLKALVRNTGGKKQPADDEIKDEFRAREIYLGMLDRLQDRLTARKITLANKAKTEDG